MIKENKKKSNKKIRKRRESSNEVYGATEMY